MTKILLLISALLITYTAISQNNSCKKDEKTLDLNSISKCKFNQKKENTRELNRTLTKIRSYKKNKNKEIRINIVALKRKLSNKNVKTAKRFNKIDRIPAFKKCANLKNKKRLTCFNKNMAKHIKKNFHYPKNALIRKHEGKVSVRFIIDKKGRVSNIKAVGPENRNLLLKETKRIISILPLFLPGKNKGKKISVKYGTTIDFKIN